MANSLATNLEKFKSLIGENEARNRLHEGSGSVCSVDPVVEREFLGNVLIYFNGRPADFVIQDLHQFFLALSHCNIPTPWISHTDVLCQSVGNSGWFPKIEGTKQPCAGEEWQQLESLLKERLIEKLGTTCKFEDDFVSTKTGRIDDSIGVKIRTILQLLSLFLTGDALLNEYINSRVSGSRKIFVSWINETAAGGEQAILLKSIFEIEYRLGTMGIFGRESSPFQLLHSVCLSPLLEEFVVIGGKDADEWLNLYYGFAVLSAFTDDLHNRLMPLSHLVDSSSISPCRFEDVRNEVDVVKGKTDHSGLTASGVPFDGLSPASKTSVDTLFEPLWTDRMHMLVKPPWHWSHHFLSKLPTIIHRVSELINNIIEKLNQLAKEPTSVTVATVKLREREHRVYEPFTKFVQISKLIAVANNKHFAFDVKEEITILDTTFVNLSLAIEEIGKLFPRNLSSRHFDLLMSSTIFCLSSLEMRLEESSTDSGLSQTCRSILDSFSRTRDHFIHLLSVTNLRWVQYYLLQDYSRCSSYSDVKPAEDDCISPSFRMWYWTMRAQLNEPFKVTALVELLEQTLGHILTRIAHTTVSESRQSQLWRDIWFLLRSTVELLVHCDDFPLVFFASDHRPSTQLAGAYRTELLWSTGRHCRTLMAVALVLCAPFEKIHAISKKNYASMVENLQRSKKRSIWYLIRPDLFVDDVPLTGLATAPFPAVVAFLLKLLSSSKPATSQRRLLTLLCLHVDQCSLTGLLLRSGQTHATGGLTLMVITGLIWILIYIEIDAAALANVLEGVLAKNDTAGSTETGDLRSAICQEPWFPAICEIVKDVIGDCLKPVDDWSLFEPTFPSLPCGCALEIDGIYQDNFQPHLLRHGLRLLPASIVHLQQEMTSSRGINLLREILLWEMKKAGWNDDTSAAMIDKHIAPTITELTQSHFQTPDDDHAASSAIDSLDSQAASIRTTVDLLQGRVQMLCEEGAMYVDAVADYILANTSYLLDVVNKGAYSDEWRGGNWAQSISQFDTDAKQETPPLDVESLDDALLARVGVLTEIEFRCLLVNRPEFWDSGMPMDERTRKHVDWIAKLYRLKSTE